MDTEKQGRSGMMWNPALARVRELVEEVRRIDADAGDVRERREAAGNLRFCRWAGQSPDGRKHASDLGVNVDEVGPFEGAPDLKVRLADRMVNEQVDLLTTAVLRAVVQAQPGESGDVVAAARASLLLRWLRDVKLADHLPDEVELSANMMLGDDPGLAVVGVFWRESEAQEVLSYDAGEIAGMAAELVGGEQAMAMAQELTGLLLDVNSEEALRLSLLSRVFPAAEEGELRAVLEPLALGERVQLRSVYVAESRPEIVALRPFEDVFFDVEAARIDAVPVFVREVLSEVELVKRVGSDGYSREVVLELLDSARGLSLLNGVHSREVLSVRGDDVPVVGEQDFEVWHCYRRVIDEGSFLPELVCTVWCAGNTEVELKHGPYDYPHAGGPFVAITRERVARGLLESRGIPAVLDSEQLEMKVQRDSRAAATMMATVPPVKKKMGRMGMRLQLAPAAEIEVHNMGDFEWLSPPPFPQGSVEVENRIDEDVRRYFGRDDGRENPLAQVRLEKQVLRFMMGWQSVFARVLACAQAWMLPVRIARVVGSEEPVLVDREEIREARDVQLKFDVRDLNVEFLMGKLKVIYEFILRLDRDGTIDTAPIVRWALGALDPHLAGLSLRDEQAAMAGEREAAMGALKDLFFGLQPEVPDRGANFQLRGQVMQEALQGSERMRGLFMSDELFRKGVTDYLEHLKSLDQQYRVNPDIGRQVKPGANKGGGSSY